MIDTRPLTDPPAGYGTEQALCKPVRYCTLSFDFDYFFAVIGAAGFAHPVSQLIFAALGALYHAGHLKLPGAGAPFIASRL